MKKNAVISLICNIVAIVLNIAAIIIFSSKGDTTVGSICLGFGSVLLGFGTFLSRKN